MADNNTEGNSRQMIAARAIWAPASAQQLGQSREIWRKEGGSARPSAWVLPSLTTRSRHNSIQILSLCAKVAP